MRKLAFALPAALLLTLVMAPAAQAPGLITGPLAFYLTSQTCDSASLSPPGSTTVVLQQASGINYGVPIAGALVVLHLNPGGYALCQPQPGGGFVSAGDGSGTIVWS